MNENYVYKKLFFNSHNKSYKSIKRKKQLRNQSFVREKTVYEYYKGLGLLAKYTGRVHRLY